MTTKDVKIVEEQVSLNRGDRIAAKKDRDYFRFEP